MESFRFIDYTMTSSIGTATTAIRIFPLLLNLTMDRYVLLEVIKLVEVSPKYLYVCSFMLYIYIYIRSYKYIYNIYVHINISYDKYVHIKIYIYICSCEM